MSTDDIVAMRDSYDHEMDDDYERMQGAENYILNRYRHFLPTIYNVD